MPFYVTYSDLLLRRSIDIIDCALALKEHCLGTLLQCLYTHLDDAVTINILCIGAFFLAYDINEPPGKGSDHLTVSNNGFVS